mmetsp:Transcript_6754/g.18852  ORF Transcript_6754/g.18852 Transcript_6754/m.18852 type:complete len:883 (-) Transcript_6754:92-2740(-)
MVEFGLKLEDNKVADWADKYIDYERLKLYIKKAKKAAEAYEALKKRRPELAAEVKAAYDAGIPYSLASGRNSATASAVSLSKAADEADEGEKEQGLELQQTKQKRSGAGPPVESISVGKEELVPLVDKAKKYEKAKPSEAERQKYGSTGSFMSLTPISSALDLTALVRQDSNVSNLIGRMTGGIFGQGNYANKLTQALKIIDENLDLFANNLDEELEKVTSFHAEKLDELEKRLEVLVESVGSNYDVISRPKPNGEEGVSTFLKLKDAVHRRVTNIMSRPSADAGSTKAGVGHLPSKSFDSDEEIVPKSSDMEYILRESDSIKRALTDLHRSTMLLNNYAVMNFTGFIKIIKKHDKSFKSRKGRFKNFMTKAESIEGELSEQLGNRMEKLFADWFCDGNIREARAKMLPKRGDGLQMDWSQLRLGYRLGMCAVLTLWVCWDCIWGSFHDQNISIGGRTAFPVFRACGGLLLVHWFWGFSVFVWQRYRINYIYLFDFNPRIVDTPMLIFNDVVDETLVFLLLMLLYYKSGAHEMPDLIPPGCYPLILVVYTVKCLIFPLRTRGPLWVAIWEVITAPLTSPKFFHTYVADVFTSMVKVFQDIVWAACYVLSGDFWFSENENNDIDPHQWQHEFWYKNVLIPLVCLFPLWIRFNQCLRRYMDTKKRFPNLANATKYAMSQTVTLFGAFHPIYLLHSHETKHHKYVVSKDDINVFQEFWMGLFIASSLYSFSWDVLMDWGLGRPEFSFLGPRLMFPNKFYYYGVMAADLVLRFMWVQSLIPPQSGASFELPSYLTAITMALELLRRTLWGFFRLEHEHRHNTEGFRRVDFVPLHFATGHQHKYKQQKEHVGFHVLAEVFVISAFVIGISFLSIMAAQRATARVGEL